MYLGFIVKIHAKIGYSLAVKETSSPWKKTMKAHPSLKIT